MMSNEILNNKKIEKFLCSKFVLECIFTIPLFFNLIYLGFMYFKIKKFIPYFQKTFHYSLTLKKTWIFLLIVFFSYEVFYIFKNDGLILISDQLFFILTIFVKIFCCVLIIVVIQEQAVKNIKTKNLNIIFFFLVIIFLLFLEIINEFRFEVVK